MPAAILTIRPPQLVAWALREADVSPAGQAAFERERADRDRYVTREAELLNPGAAKKRALSEHPAALPVRDPVERIRAAVEIVRNGGGYVEACADGPDAAEDGA